MTWIFSLLVFAGTAEAQTRVIVPSVPATVATQAPIRIQVPRVQIAPIVPPTLYSGYPNGYVPYNQRLLNPALTPPSSILLQPAAPVRALPNPLRLGATNPAPRFSKQSGERFNTQYSNELVRSVQSELRRRGYYAGAVDGIFGPASQSALQQYQAELGRTPNGQIDQGTLATLGIIR